MYSVVNLSDPSAPVTTAQPYLVFEDVTKTYPGVTALQGVSFGVREGERFTRLRRELRSILDLPAKQWRAFFMVILGPERLRRFPPFRRRIDRIIRPILAEVLGDRRRQRRLAVVDMPDRPDIHMRLRTLKLAFGHFSFPGRLRLGFGAGA